MLRVDSSKPCQIIYAIARHEYLSYVIEPHIVQLNPNGEFSLTHQRLFSNTAKEFANCLDESDLKLIKILDDLEQGAIIKRYYKKPVRPFEFFSKIFNDQLYDAIRPKMEKKMVEALNLLPDKQLYQMSKEGYPAGKQLHIAAEPASVLFHFRRDEQEIRYFPTIKYQGLRIEFMFKNAEIICNHPAWMMLDDTLYYFDKDIEGKKLLPFLNKRYIAIPRSSEHSYFERFVIPLIEKYPVYAEGFTINTEKYEATPILKPIHIPGGTSQIQLCFKYAGYVFPYGDGRHVSVRMDKDGDSYIFHRIKRSVSWEKNRLAELESLGLEITSGLFHNLEVKTNDTTDTDQSFSVFDWLNQHHQQLSDKGYQIDQPDGQKRYLFGSNKIDLEVTEGNDWFDIYAVVHFGPYKIPFIDLRNHILNRKKEFVLPSGEIAVIPEQWFSQYGNLLHFAENGAELKLRKHHIGLLSELSNEGELAGIAMDRKLQKLNNFEEVADAPMPVNFQGSLRPYQQAGYNWFHFLREYHFGGCLADDMGLGKTVQTLALLQKNKEDTEAAGGKSTSLLIMPTSLIYNWINEAKKFAPQLRMMVHTGAFRYKDPGVFGNYDVVVTTYGISRIDIELFKSFFFDYVILDESQNIKNPSSKSYQAVKQLKSRFKLILSGTPVENSVNDLWTQMSFINPGLLGSQQFFMNEFVTPIEKKKDEEKARKLQAIIKPFVLRRTKEQVATELPPKTEHLFYSQMSEEQSAVYEEVKSEYRNELLKSLEDGTFAQTQMQVLQGLIKLRQIANHPSMIDEQYEGDSGKFEDVVHTLSNVLDGGHKVLIFSQFVKQLQIYRRYFEDKHIPYSYLDGSTQNRGEIVKQFQEDQKTKVFLISIKAGGVGLNLTEADYVFILDPWWNPAVEQQAIDRTHRIGQTKNVFIYKFITKDSVEEKILALQQRKLSVARSLITTEESFIKTLTADDIRDILA
ncbi:DEAD/DEAH box helicase [Mucilaginibacter myungsuensis]|uniref:DEAD/DEAH box helicase n=1 Tax=Mucilaginibacter myungsuensis TaxID=649104 RepID=A0A929L4S3_9SPHI|nr:DEAD/DEAH box helicase [Mucilaginibacter myungsuensis]MBE9664005.1 DEAD/DEAH box helicase [Mucilaginibacter myungsuensis]MDN3601184.1 DEAD/DEAH box helicase [Mucilaginibacter myungsuensis]